LAAVAFGTAGAMSASGGASAVASETSTVGTLEDFEAAIASVKKHLTKDQERMARLVWCAVMRGCSCPQPESANAKRKRAQKCTCVHCARVTGSEYIPTHGESMGGFSLYNFLRQFSSVIDRVCRCEEGFWRIAKKFYPVFGASWELVKAQTKVKICWDDPRRPGKEQGHNKCRPVINARIVRQDEITKDKHVLKARLAELVCQAALLGIVLPCAMCRVLCRVLCVTRDGAPS
jgi:hypothetical protein